MKRQRRCVLAALTIVSIAFMISSPAMAKAHQAVTAVDGGFFKYPYPMNLEARQGGLYRDVSDMRHFASAAMDAVDTLKDPFATVESGDVAT